MTDYKEIREKLKAEKKKGSFIFLPSPIMEQADSYYQPIVEMIKLREDEIYKAQGKFRIHYNGLLRFALAAAIEWSAIDTCRTDSRADKMYCSFRAVGGVRKADGKIYFHKAEKDLDLEIVEEELKDQYAITWDKIGDSPKVQWKKHGHKSKDSFVEAMVRRDLLQKRKNKLMFTESGAKARVIRFILGLQSQYSNEDQLLNTNFVLVRYALNPNHPDVKKALIGSLSASQHMIYGGVKDTGQIAYTGEDTDDIIDIGRDDEEPGTDTEPGPGPGPENENKFKPDPKRDQDHGTEDGQLIDFQNCDAETQARTLQSMCDACGQSYDHYDKQVKGGVIEAAQERRDDFFTWLKTEKEKN